MTLETTTYGADSQRLMVQAGDENSPYRTNYAWSGSVVIAEYSESHNSGTDGEHDPLIHTKAHEINGLCLVLFRLARVDSLLVLSQSSVF